jgi:hypothetical protein
MYQKGGETTLAKESIPHLSSGKLHLFRKKNHSGTESFKVIHRHIEKTTESSCFGMQMAPDSRVGISPESMLMVWMSSAA